MKYHFTIYKFDIKDVCVFIKCPSMFIQISGSSTTRDYPQNTVPGSLCRIFLELNLSISTMLDTKKLNNIMTKLLLASIKMKPVVEQIVNTTTIYSEYEFKQKLRNNEPIFYLQRADLLRAVDASKLLSEVRNELQFDLPPSEKSEQINTLQIEEVGKSIASSMKEVIVNTVTTYSQKPAKSDKVYLDADMIQRLMQLHENIIGNMDALQNDMQKEINPLVKDLESLHGMSSSEQRTPKTKGRSTKTAIKFKTKPKKFYISNNKPKKLIILPTEEDPMYDYDPIETYSGDNITEGKSRERNEVLTRISTDSNNASPSIRYGRTINLDIGDIDNATNTFSSIEKIEDEKLHSYKNTTIDEKTIESYVRIPSSEINKKIIEFPKPYLEPLRKITPPRITRLDDGSFSEAKKILCTCVEKLSYIHNHLNEQTECSLLFNSEMKKLVAENENLKRNLYAKDEIKNISRGDVMQVDVSTDTVDLDRKCQTKCSQTNEFRLLILKVLEQIESMQNNIIEKIKIRKKNVTVDDIPGDKYIPQNVSNVKEGIFCDIVNKNRKKKNRKDTKKMAAFAKLKATFSNSVNMDICPTKIMNVRSVLQILCAQDLYHPDSIVKAQLNNIGLQNLINSAGPCQCCKLTIINDPRDFPEIPLKPSICSLPLSQSDLAVIQDNVNRMKEMLMETTVG